MNTVKEASQRILHLWKTIDDSRIRMTGYGGLTDPRIWGSVIIDNEVHIDFILEVQPRGLVLHMAYETFNIEADIKGLSLQFVIVERARALSKH